ncbi:putative coiled-coil domain-containing protein like protein [Amylocarpus encephaloides]|uniref:Coiled-coil domain-containing protein like protein n=1 Tax=Amylocarpus encephaloides TaxID=45428 RepID=A0A9P7YNN9_9HELO|nr:putative coiled-coil domain-containing protein like protein [Amylocarpus encephaloides]
MAGKKAAGESAKKASGNQKKAEAAAAKANAENAKKSAAEDQEWSKGAKSNAKKEAEAEKKAEAARKKAEKDALLAAEEKDSRAAPKNSKQAAKKTKGLDLSQLDDTSSSSKASALNATGIDNALDALSLATDTSAAKIDKHPERRFKAAYAAYEERRLQEMESDGSGQGLRQNQKKEKIRKEFEKHPDNPFNQVSANYDASKEELKEIKEGEKAKIEARLGK